MLNKIKVLLTGSGAPGWMSIFRCLKENKEREIEIYGCDVEKETYGKCFAKKHFNVKRGNKKGYSKQILRICKQEKIDIIIPITDPELIPLSKDRKLFEKNNIKVAVSDLYYLEIVSNKLDLYYWLETKELPFPKFYSMFLWDIADSKKIAKKLGYPKKPVCFKPAVAHGSRGLKILDASRNSLSFLDEKPQDLMVSGEKLKDIVENGSITKRFLLMEYLPGKEWTVDTFIENGKIKYIIPRLRVKMKGGITTEGKIDRNKKVIDLTEKILSTFFGELDNLNYCIGIQFKEDEKGNPKVLEINPRLQGTTIMSYGAGINIPYFTVKSILGEKVPTKKIKWNTYMYRYWQEVFI